MNYPTEIIVVGVSLILGFILLPGGIIHLCNRGDRKMTLGVICVVFGFTSLIIPHLVYLLYYFGELG